MKTLQKHANTSSDGKCAWNRNTTNGGLIKQVQQRVDRQHGKVEFFLISFLVDMDFSNSSCDGWARSIYQTAPFVRGPKAVRKICSFVARIGHPQESVSLGFTRFNRSYEKCWRVRTHVTPYHIAFEVSYTPRRTTWTKTWHKALREFFFFSDSASTRCVILRL